MVTGGGHSHLEETLSVLRVPLMSKKSFINSERDIGCWWKEKLEKINEGSRGGREKAGRREGFFP